MENVIFTFEVVEAAKAHVGKELSVRADGADPLHYSDGRAILYGSALYNGLDYAVTIYHPKGKPAVAQLDAWPECRSRLTFSNVKLK